MNPVCLPQFTCQHSTSGKALLHRLLLSCSQLENPVLIHYQFCIHCLVRVVSQMFLQSSQHQSLSYNLPDKWFLQKTVKETKSFESMPAQNVTYNGCVESQAIKSGRAQLWPLSYIGEPANPAQPSAVGRSVQCRRC